MPAPSPDQLSRTIADLLDLLSRGVEVGGQGSRNQSRRESVVDGYRWLHTAGYDRKVGGEATANVCKKCRGQKWVGHWDDDEEWQLDRPYVVCEACTSSTGSDPTGDTIIARRDVMKALDKVGGYASQALEAVSDMISELQGIVGKVDQGVRIDQPNERAIPRTATRAEVDAAKDAQARRVERGEGHGAA